MEKVQYRFVYNRKNQLNENGEALVQLEALLNRKKSYFSTHIHLPPECWNARKKIVVNHPLADDLNTMLYQERNRVESLELAEWKRSGSMSISILRNLVRNNIKVGDFIAFSKEVIASSDRSKGTKGNLTTTLKRLTKFRSSIQFNDITYTFLREFDQYLSGEHRNTAAKHEFLTPEELKMVEGVPHCQIVDAFLFCCYTGLRYSDFTHLGEDNIVMIDGNQWLVFRTRKTSIEQKLPLHLLFDGKALEILSRRTLADLTDIGCNADANKKLRQVLPDCGKKVTWHTARHTFATVLTYKGVPVTTVQKLLGHTDIKTTMIYSDVTSATIMKDLSSVEQNGKKNKKVRMY